MLRRMPIYEYEHQEPHGEGCGERFEAHQAMSAAPLERCPRCGVPCRRVPSSFGVSGSAKALLSPKNLEAHGFTQYTRKGKGYYEKTAGPGPKAVAGDD